MSVEGFVRAAGGVMGQARDGFGTGVGVLLPLPPLAPAPPPALAPLEGRPRPAAPGRADLPLACPPRNFIRVLMALRISLLSF